MNENKVTPFGFDEYLTSKPRTEIHDEHYIYTFDNQIKELTVEDAKPHWIIDRKFGNDVMSGDQMVMCSECYQGIMWGPQRYCPNCGAKMSNYEEED